MLIRPAQRGDVAFILHVTPRLIEFGDVPGRTRADMIARDRDVIAQTLDEPSGDAALFVAEDDRGSLVGFIHVTTATDYYSNSTTAHIADVVVTPEAGGQGIGSALIAYAEHWARERGFEMLTLNVFIQNQRARELYRRLGFDEEWIRAIKRL